MRHNYFEITAQPGLEFVKLKKYGYSNFLAIYMAYFLEKIHISKHPAKLDFYENIQFYNKT